MSTTLPRTDRAFGTFLRSAGKLAFARQVSALLLVGAVMFLPAVTSRGVATDFAWSYFSMLTISSLLGFGLERLAGTMVAGRGDVSTGRVVAPVLVARVATAPVAAVALAVLLCFVGVTLPVTAWLATLVWVVAALVEAVLFGGLRAAGNSTVEPVVMVTVRLLQAGALVGLAVVGAPLGALVAWVALVEAAGAVAAFRSVMAVNDLRGSWSRVRELPMRDALPLAGIEVVGLFNLRVDLLLVGRILGAARGATYGLLYRAVDGFNGAVGSAGLWLYAESANARDGGTDGAGLRARSLVLLPRPAVAAGVAVVLGAGLVGDAVPRLGAEVDTLRYFAAAFPLLAVNSIELHVRSGRGRNREVLAVNTATLVLNLVVCVLLLTRFGLPGAALALVLSELWQAMLLWVTAPAEERSMVAPAVLTATVGAVGLLALGGVLT